MKRKKREPISEETRARLLLWCARHCCFCGKACRTNIEIHHVDGDRSNNETDNLIPLCFDCHGELTRYGIKHRIGMKYRYLEIKNRRDQIYELHTLRYLRLVDINISRYLHHIKSANGKPISRQWGDVSCTVRTLSEDLPVQIRLSVVPYQDEGKLNVILDDLYSGRALWNLNPGQTVFGHFGLPITRESKPFSFRLEIFCSIIDVLQREHQMLPFSYVWSDPEADWWFDPRIKYSAIEGQAMIS